MTTSSSGPEATEKFRALMKGVKTAMVTTARRDGSLQSRPLMLLEDEDDARLWFFVSADTDWVAEMADGAATNVSVNDEDGATWVSISGWANVVDDGERNGRLWNAAAKRFFSGPDDPALRLLGASIETVDYWDAPSHAVVRLLGMAHAIVTGDPESIPGEHGTLDITGAEP